MNELRVKGMIDLVSEQPNEGFKSIFFNIGVKSPNRFEYRLAHDGSPGVSQKKLEEAVFASR
jgi:hypothetical protein